MKRILQIRELRPNTLRDCVPISRISKVIIFGDAHVISGIVSCWCS